MDALRHHLLWICAGAAGCSEIEMAKSRPADRGSGPVYQTDSALEQVRDGAGGVDGYARRVGVEAQSLSS